MKKLEGAITLSTQVLRMYDYVTSYSYNEFDDFNKTKDFVTNTYAMYSNITSHYINFSKPSSTLDSLLDVYYGKNSWSWKNRTDDLLEELNSNYYSLSDLSNFKKTLKNNLYFKRKHKQKYNLLMKKVNSLEQMYL